MLDTAPPGAPSVEPPLILLRRRTATQGGSGAEASYRACRRRGLAYRSARFVRAVYGRRRPLPVFRPCRWSGQPNPGTISPSWRLDWRPKKWRRPSPSVGSQSVAHAGFAAITAASARPSSHLSYSNVNLSLAIPIEGYSVVAQKARIAHLLEKNAIETPNVTALADDDIWRCSFMTEANAQKFMRSLEKLDLNVSQGPDSDVVLVNEFDQSVTPHCEWLLTGKWKRAVIAWKAGTRPESVVAREGWSPQIGSGLSFCDGSAPGNLKFLRLENNVEVYLNKETGKEVYIGRTSTPVEAMFKTAAQVIGNHFVTAGEKPLHGQTAVEVTRAVEMLETVMAAAPDSWNALGFMAKVRWRWATLNSPTDRFDGRMN